jgi:hypothetical protein
MPLWLRRHVTQFFAVVVLFIGITRSAAQTWSASPPPNAAANIPVACSCADISGPQAAYSPHFPLPAGATTTVTNNCARAISLFLIQDTDASSLTTVSSPLVPIPGRRFMNTVVMPGESIKIDVSGVVGSLLEITSCPANKVPASGDVVDMKWSEVAPDFSNQPEAFDGPVFCHCAQQSRALAHDPTQPITPYPVGAKANFENACSFPISVVAQQDQTVSGMTNPTWHATPGRRFGETSLLPGQEVDVGLGGSVADFAVVNSCPDEAAPDCDICDPNSRPICANSHSAYNSRLLKSHGMSPVAARALAEKRVIAETNQCLIGEIDYAHAHPNDTAHLYALLGTPDELKLREEEVDLANADTRAEAVSIYNSAVDQLTKGGDLWFKDEDKSPITDTYCAEHNTPKIYTRQNMCMGQVPLTNPESYTKYVFNQRINGCNAVAGSGSCESKSAVYGSPQGASEPLLICRLTWNTVPPGGVSDNITSDNCRASISGDRKQINYDCFASPVPDTSNPLGGALGTHVAFYLYTVELVRTPVKECTPPGTPIPKLPCGYWNSPCPVQ